MHAHEPAGQKNGARHLSASLRRVNLREFEAAFRELVAAQKKSDGNVKCLACERCARCVDCTFCKDGNGLSRCHYCTRCTDCTDCSHCESSTGCLACTHCVESERCAQSAYLTRCVGCSGCTYCFGCVGLSRKDFHILNEPYDRQTYFEIVKGLEREMRR